MIAILSDIHANLEALESVVEDLKDRDVDRVICLGDMVGYGPDPDGVIDLIREQGYECILGNHEAAFVKKKYRDWLNFQAKENNEETEQLLSAENLQYCKELPASIIVDDFCFVHGFPPESFLTYLKNCADEVITELFASGGQRLYFTGHTHTLSVVYERDGGIMRRKLACGEMPLDQNGKYILNCGSVGQPRDGNRKAKYLLFDPGEYILEVVCLDYDVEKTIEKVTLRGFPAVYGTRLR